LPAACPGWGFRRTLFGADAEEARARGPRSLAGGGACPLRSDAEDAARM